MLIWSMLSMFKNIYIYIVRWKYDNAGCSLFAEKKIADEGNERMESEWIECRF